MWVQFPSFKFVTFNQSSCAKSLLKVRLERTWRKLSQKKTVEEGRGDPLVALAPPFLSESRCLERGNDVSQPLGSQVGVTTLSAGQGRVACGHQASQGRAGPARRLRPASTSCLQWGHSSERLTALPLVQHRSDKYLWNVF